MPLAKDPAESVKEKGRKGFELRDKKKDKSLPCEIILQAKLLRISQGEKCGCRTGLFSTEKRVKVRA